jgi:hypothetical protein
MNERDSSVDAPVNGDAPEQSARNPSKFRKSRMYRFIAEQPAGLAVCLVALVMYLWFYLAERARVMPGNSDPHYIWMYARSLVFDHDFDFTNDYRICGDPFRLGKYRGTVHPDNPYYLGPTLFLAPALWLFRAIVSVSPSAPPDVVAACHGPVASLSMGVGCVLGAVTLFLAYRLARRFASDGVAAVAAALFGWGGLLAAYSGLWPNYSHVFSTFGVALVALMTARAAEKPQSWWRWAFVALAVAIGTWQRPPQLIYGLVPLVAAVHQFHHDRKRLLRVLLVLAGGAVAGTIPLLLHFKYLYGHYLASPVQGPYIHLAHAHPFLLLFGPHGGLFYVTPVAWLAVIGLWFALRRVDMRPMVIPLVIAGAVEGFIYSSALDWHGAGTFGARRLTSLTPLFIVLSVAALGPFVQWLEARPKRAIVLLSFTTVIPIAAMTQGMMLGQSRGTIPCCRGASQSELYGGGAKALFGALDETIGDVAVLPASLVFAARYRVAPNRFRDATEPIFYVRDFRRLDFIAHGFSLDDTRLVTDGLTIVKHGARLTKQRARVVFGAEWPFATKLQVDVQSSEPGRLRVGFGGVWNVRWLDTIEIGPDKQVTTVLTVPPGVFSSGIVEMVFEVEGAAPDAVVIQRVQIEDEGKYD